MNDPLSGSPDNPSITVIAGPVGPAGGYFGVVVTYFSVLPSYTGS